MINPQTLHLISIGATLIVGVILSSQIKSQSRLLNHYKDYVSVLDPEKIKVLHETVIRNLKKTMKFDIDTLQTQVIELATTVHYACVVFELQHSSVGKTFDRDAVYSQMPHCREKMAEIENKHHEK